MVSKRIPILLLCLAGATSFVIPSERYYEEIHVSGEAIDLAYSCVKVSKGYFSVDSQAPVLLLHGITSDQNSWNGIHEAIAIQTGRRVCRVDARNHGKSPWSEEFSISLMVKDTINLMDSLKMPKAIILGHSMGGATAMKLALEHLERVEKLIVEEMCASVRTVELAKMNATIQLLLRSLDAVPPGLDEDAAKEAVIKYIKDRITKIPGGNAFKKELDGLKLMLDCPEGKCKFKMNIDAARKAYEDPGFMTHVLEGTYEGDALFVYGQLSDVRVGEDKEKILTLFPHAKFVEIERAGHLVHAEKSKEFLDAVIWFIKENFIVSK